MGRWAQSKRRGGAGASWPLPPPLAPVVSPVSPGELSYDWTANSPYPASAVNLGTQYSVGLGSWVYWSSDYKGEDQATLNLDTGLSARVRQRWEDGDLHALSDWGPPSAPVVVP